jgi:hypothetical protein
MNEPNKSLIKLINQFYDLQKKISLSNDAVSYQRHLERMANSFGELGLEMHDPTGELFNETRTDCEASIVGDIGDKMVVAEVIKPIIYLNNESSRKTILQRGVVLIKAIK